MNPQHRPHGRVQGAKVGKFALRTSRIGPGLAGANFAGIEATGLGGCGVGKWILVDPYDRIAGFHRQNLGVEADAADRHRVCGGRGANGGYLIRDTRASSWPLEAASRFRKTDAQPNSGGTKRGVIDLRGVRQAKRGFGGDLSTSCF